MVGTPATLAVKQATSHVPIVFVAVSDPVGTGLVAGLGRPGGNVTGLANQQSDLAGKRLQLLQEVVPGLRRLAILLNVDNPASLLEIGDVQIAARTLGLDVAIVEIRRAELAEQILQREHLFDRCKIAADGADPLAVEP